MSTRAIRKIIVSVPTMEGAGVRLRRAFGHAQVPQFDPFLLLDDFGSDNPDDYMAGFPWHPHRGIETVTYMLNGLVEHGDSMGNSGVIGAGDVQWMTAGGGIIHQEMPGRSPDGPLMKGFQLWANLPAAHKMMTPRYQEITADQIPTAQVQGASVKVICGQVGDALGPVLGIVTDPEYLDVSMQPNTRFEHPVQPGYTVFAYTIEGSGCFDPARDPYGHPVEGSPYLDADRDCETGPQRVVLYEREGDRVLVTTEDEGARFLLISGRPLGEPVAWYGPIVMNTEDELRVAFGEYRDGTFLRHD